MTWLHPSEERLLLLTVVSAVDISFRLFELLCLSMRHELIHNPHDNTLKSHGWTLHLKRKRNLTQKSQRGSVLLFWKKPFHSSAPSPPLALYLARSQVENKTHLFTSSRKITGGRLTPLTNPLILPEKAVYMWHRSTGMVGGNGLSLTLSKGLKLGYYYYYYLAF